MHVKYFNDIDVDSCYDILCRKTLKFGARQTNIRRDIYVPNVGGSLKGLAIFLAVIGIIASTFLGISIIASGEGMVIGIVYLIAGPMLSCFSSWIVYAFGENNEMLHRFDRWGGIKATRCGSVEAAISKIKN
jgi:hypothetical protein